MIVNCIHHWDMGTSFKGIVRAKCRKCLAETDFSNNPVYIRGTFGTRKKAVISPVTAMNINTSA